MPVLGGKHGADLNLAIRFDALPHTVPGTHAAPIFRQRYIRPRNIRRSGHGAAASARLFMCAECRAQALICSHESYVFKLTKVM